MVFRVMMPHIFKVVTSFLGGSITIFCSSDGCNEFLSEIVVNTFNSIQTYNAEDHDQYSH
jgi:hypothetical protein